MVGAAGRLAKQLQPDLLIAETVTIGGDDLDLYRGVVDVWIFYSWVDPKVCRELRDKGHEVWTYDYVSSAPKDPVQYCLLRSWRAQQYRS